MPNPKDLNDLPCYEKAFCETCKGRSGRRGKCWDCNKRIPFYRGMGGNGYRSITADHMHFKDMGTRTIGKSVVNKELCLECFLKDYMDNYGYYPERFLDPEVERIPSNRHKELEERIIELEKAVSAQENFIVSA